MKLAIAFVDEIYGTVEETAAGGLLIEDDADGNVASTLDEFRQWNIGGERRLLNDYDLLRTLPARLCGYNQAPILEATDTDRSTIAAWKEVAAGRLAPEAVETSHVVKLWLA
jgi:hypothetical protein